jgi:hypothetical protein
MKKVKLFLSMALFSAVAFGALASAKKSSAVMITPGYIKQGINCVVKGNCSTILTPNLCTDVNGVQLFDKTDATHCALELWRIP